MSDFTLYSMPSSGNSYKVRLLLSLTGQSYTHVPLETNTAELRQARADGHLPLGKLPALHLENGEILTESGAILWYLTDGSPFEPSGSLAKARALEWMFFEQNRLEPVIAVRASLNCYPHLAEQATPERMQALLDQGNELLSLVDTAVAKAPWLTGDHPTLADISLYGYIHSSETRGGYDMSRFPNIINWCARIAALPNYIALDHIP